MRRCARTRPRNCGGRRHRVPGTGVGDADAFYFSCTGNDRCRRCAGAGARKSNRRRDRVSSAAIGYDDTCHCTCKNRGGCCCAGPAATTGECYCRRSCVATTANKTSCAGHTAGADNNVTCRAGTATAAGESNRRRCVSRTCRCDGHAADRAAGKHRLQDRRRV